MAEQTVREQLVEALKEFKLACAKYPDLKELDATWPQGSIYGVACNALDRARAEPEGGDFRRRETLLVTLDGLFDSDYRSIAPDEWARAKAAFKAARSELQCPDGCDTSCLCYQEGLEAQRERVGGGTA